MSDEDIKLPYVTNPGKIREYFNKIIEVETPAKFTMNFLSDVMLFKGKNDRNLMPLLKSMGFLDGNGIPTQLYSDYKIDDNKLIKIADSEDSKKGIIREFETGVYMTIETAKEIHKWLGDQISNFETQKNKQK